MKTGIAVSLAGLVVALSGCHRAVLAPHGTNVSSETSDYSPVVRLAVALPILVAPDGRTVVVQVDSGIVRAPGMQLGDMLPIMRELYLAAMIAVDGRRKPAAGQPEPSWTTLGASDSVPLAPALRLGEQRTIRAFTVRLVADSSFDPRKAFLVFKVTGAAVTREVGVDGFPVARLRRGAIRVYACAPWTLAGHLDPDRARHLSLAYNAAC